MKKVLLFALVAGLVSCSNFGEVKADLDSTVNKVKNSETMDSIEAKGGRILDSVKSKGGKLLNKAEEKIDGLKKKDSVK